MFMSKWMFTLLLCVCLQGTPFAAAADERVLYNGKTFTGEPEHPYAEAVAIRGDKIVAAGNRSEASKAVASGVEMIDLKGDFLRNPAGILVEEQATERAHRFRLHFRQRFGQSRVPSCLRRIRHPFAVLGPCDRSRPA